MAKKIDLMIAYVYSLRHTTGVWRTDGRTDGRTDRHLATA